MKFLQKIAFFIKAIISDYNLYFSFPFAFGNLSFFVISVYFNIIVNVIVSFLICFRKKTTLYYQRLSSQTSVMDKVVKFCEPGRAFAKDSIRLVKRCTKPDRKEFQKIAIATAVGFCIMGFIGFFVKLIHIPINNIIVGS